MPVSAGPVRCPEAQRTLSAVDVLGAPPPGRPGAGTLGLGSTPSWGLSLSLSPAVVLLSEKSWERGWHEHLRARVDGPTAVGSDLPLDGRLATRPLWSRVDSGQRVCDQGHDRGGSAVETPHAARELHGGCRRT